MTSWAAQSFRVTWFGSGLDKVQAEQVFGAAFGTEAETIQRNRVPSAANPFWGKAMGKTGQSIHAEVQIQPGRLDIVVLPESEEVAPTLPLAWLDQNISAISAALGNLGAAVRLAVVTEAVQLVPDAASATKLAQDLAGFGTLSPDVTDFSLQMNKRRPFACTDDRLMNRLVRWGTATFQVVQVSVTGEGSHTSPATQLSHATSIFMDLNNVPSKKVIELSEQVSMYRELADEILHLLEDPRVAQVVGQNV